MSIAAGTVGQKVGVAAQHDIPGALGQDDRPPAFAIAARAVGGQAITAQTDSGSGDTSRADRPRAIGEDLRNSADSRTARAAFAASPARAKRGDAGDRDRPVDSVDQRFAAAAETARVARSSIECARPFPALAQRIDRKRAAKRDCPVPRIDIGEAPGARAPVDHPQCPVGITAQAARIERCIARNIDPPTAAHDNFAAPASRHAAGKIIAEGIGIDLQRSPDIDHPIVQCVEARGSTKAIADRARPQPQVGLRQQADVAPDRNRAAIAQQVDVAPGSVAGELERRRVGAQIPGHVHGRTCAGDEVDRTSDHIERGRDRPARQQRNIPGDRNVVPVAGA